MTGVEIPVKNLRNRFERFCFKHRTKGIPNLMLYLTVGAALVYLMSFAANNNVLYYWLCFDRTRILRGEIWRLITYPLTYSAGNILLTAISLFCYYSLGRAMESVWGTFRFNLFYFSGVLLMDVFCMIFPGLPADVTYLNLSLFLGYATLYPDSRFLLFFIIPVRAWIFALFDLVMTVVEVVMLSRMLPFPYYLYPLIAIGNYFLFFGKDVLNVIPMSWRVKIRRGLKKQPKQPKQTSKGGTIPFPGDRQTNAPSRANYTHRCTVCGRTDVSNPELEFRYCSRCHGYYCYCEDHISNHSHITE